MELREYIIDKAKELMLRFGVSSVTMDAIASQCGISKRTLYEHFSDKRTLVRLVLQQMNRYRSVQVSRAIKESSNKLDALLRIYFITREDVTQVSEVFVSDIERLYPDIQLECSSHNREYVAELASLLRHGQHEGVFRETCNPRVTATLFFLQMRCVKPNISKFPEGISVVEVLDSLFINFVRGIASHEGLEIIDKALAEHNIEKKLK